MSDLNATQITEPYQKLAGIYDQVMDHVNYRQWARYIKTIVKGYQSNLKYFADLSCGSGSFLAQMSLKRTVRIGGDLSLSMLQQAKNKEALSRVPFSAMDFCTLPFKTSSLQAAVALYDSVNYVLTREAVVQFFLEVNRILEPGGVFIFDAVTPYICKTTFRDYSETNHIDDHTSYFRHSWYDFDTQIQYNAFLINTLEGETEEVHEQKIRPMRAWKKLLKESPLQLESVYGDFTLRPVHRKSERAHFVCLAT